jgi:hypothetical protein
MDPLDIEQSRAFEQPLQQSDWDMFNLLYSNPDVDIQVPPASESVVNTLGSGTDVASQQSYAVQEQVRTSTAILANTSAAALPWPTQSPLTLHTATK